MSLLEKASLICTPNAYKTSKLYSVVPNTTLGDMDVVRATTATRVNSAGLISSVGVNIPRIDYTNGTCPSLLVEPQRTNLFNRSDDIANAFWTKENSSISSNTIIAPDGNLTGDKLVENTSNSQHTFGISIGNSISITTAQVVSISFYAKAGERTSVFAESRSNINNDGFYAFFNLLNGTVSSSGTIAGGTLSSTSIIDVGNGWYRCVVSGQCSTGTAVRPRFILCNTTTNNTYTGNGTSGLFIWGAQLEAGSYASSYIPSVASTVTRNADVISKTGISSLIGQTEGTVYVEGKFNDISVAFKRLLFISDSGVTNTIQLRSGANASSLQVVFSKNGATQVLSSTSIVSFTNMNKIAVRYSLNNVKLFINGAFVLQDTSCEIPINLSNFSVSDETTIKTEILFQTALTDQECIALTTL